MAAVVSRTGLSVYSPSRRLPEGLLPGEERGQSRSEVIFDLITEDSGFESFESFEI